MDSEKDFSIKKIEEYYSNYFKIGYKRSVFVFHFGQYNTEGKEADVSSRIVTRPKDAKVLSKILQESLWRYEKAHGIINDED